MVRRPEHKRWLAYETHALLHYARAAKVPTGFGWLGQDGEVDPAHPIELWITGRMTFAFSLGALMGIPGCRRYADHGVRALNGPLRDPVNGGWYSAIGLEPDAEGRGVPVDRDAARSATSTPSCSWLRPRAAARRHRGPGPLLVG